MTGVIARLRPRQFVLLRLRAINAVRTAAAFAMLVVSVRRNALTELWIGDSHAQHYNRGQTFARLFRGRDGQFVYHHGPRLMYSIATRGFDNQVLSFVRLVRRVSPPGRILLVLTAGEIDVRCHLVPQSSSPGFSFDFVDAYVARAIALADMAGAETMVLTMHPPVSPSAPDRREYPVRGSGEDRIAISEQLRREVHRAAASHGETHHILVLDATDELADASGALRPEVTDDEIHTNVAGIAVVRARLRELISRG